MPAPLFYPSFQSLYLADQIFDEAAKRVAGFVGRVGAAWYWRLEGGTLVTFRLDYTVTEERWDVIRAKATNAGAGTFNSAEFPFTAYGTSAESPPYIHDLKGMAEWANRLYFSMGDLINDITLWLEMLHAAVINPQVALPSAFPILSSLERELVEYAMEEMDSYFTLTKLHEVFKGRISRRRLGRLAQKWESMGLLTATPRRVTYALRALVEDME